MGWVIEVIYRSVTQRKFVNAGFLYGPFIPTYGIGAAIVILLQYLFGSWRIVPRILIFGLALTSIEYLIGYFSEKIFKLTLWDYSENRFNLHGKICLPFSICWTIIAAIFVIFIHPIFLTNILKLDALFIEIAAITFLIYYVIDNAFSLIFIAEFQEKIAYLYAEYFNLSNVEIQKILDSFQRLRNAFPDLNKYINNKINNNIKTRINSFLKSVQDRLSWK